MTHLIQQLRAALDSIQVDIEYLHALPKPVTPSDYVRRLCWYSRLIHQIKHAQDLADVIMDETRKYGID